MKKMSFWTRAYFQSLFLVCLCFTVSVKAAPPDPIAFAWAIERNDIAKVRAWLDEGLNPEFQGNEIGSGLMIAAWYGHVPMMALFVERGANPRRSNRFGEQPIQLAAWNGHTEAVKWLLAHGASVNRDGNFWNALHYAVFNGHTELARFLIDQGADVNARSPNGSTPLMMAAREGHDTLAQALLEAGADTKLRNEWGDDALTMAMRYDHYQIGKMVSTPEQFETAVKAPKSQFGTPSRSSLAPPEVEALLRKIREAEANHQPTEALRQELMRALNKVKQQANLSPTRRPIVPPPYQPRSIVITAKRGHPGFERAEVVNKAVKPAPQGGVQGAQGASSSELAELVRQIRLAEVQGQPTEALKKRLDELLEKVK